VNATDERACVVPGSSFLPIRWAAKMAGRVLVASLVLVMAWALCVSAGAAKNKTPQSRNVSGLVMDEAENIIPGAAVELTDVQSGKVIDIYSQEDGSYKFTDLSFSHDYKLKATFKGASSEVRQVSSIDMRTRLVINLTIPGQKH